jgi:hypothetical protein
MVGFMKAIAGLAAATLLFAGSAVEASPWVVEISPLVPEFTWTGCYLGLGRSIKRTTVLLWAVE